MPPTGAEGGLVAGNPSLRARDRTSIAAIKYAVMMLIIRPMLVATEQMIADVFTKATDEKTFHRCKHELRNTGRGARETRKISKMRAALSRMVGA